MGKTVIGVFKSRGQAEKAVDELKEAGLREDEVSIVSRDERGDGGGGRGPESRGGDADGDLADLDVAGQDVGTGVAWGGGAGGAAGLLAGAGALAIPGIGPILAAGPLAALLTGAVTGGLAGGLVDYGVPEARGREFEKKVKEGGILTVVHASDDKAGKVEDILRRNGAEDVESHERKSREH
ncbi:MAG: hypothetical protein C4551_01365 [Bacillota bacterium]|nr:MAG: hypothetical protein C4551_01365 [Bacillota bacterium]